MGGNRDWWGRRLSRLPLVDRRQFRVEIGVRLWRHRTALVVYCQQEPRVPARQVLGIFGTGLFTLVMATGLSVVAEALPGMLAGLLLGTLTQIALVIAGFVQFGLRLIDDGAGG